MAEKEIAVRNAMDLFGAEMALLEARQADKQNDPVTLAALQEAIKALQAIEYRVAAVRKFQEKHNGKHDLFQARNR